MLKVKVIKFLLDTSKKLYLLLIISFAILVFLGELELITEIGGVRAEIIGTYMLIAIILAPVLRFMISLFTNWDFDIEYMEYLERKKSPSTRITYSSSYSSSYSNSYEDEEDDYKSNNTNEKDYSGEKEKKYLDVYSAMNLGMSTEDVINYNLGDYDTVMKYQETALHIDKTDEFFGG